MVKGLYLTENKIQCRYYKGELTFSEVDLEEAKETQNAGSVKVTEAAEKVQHNSWKILSTLTVES